MNFEEMDIELSTRKNDGFWLLWEIFKEHIKHSIIMAVLRKANGHSVVICRLIKKSIKINPRRKTDSNFDFSQAA